MYLYSRDTEETKNTSSSSSSSESKHITRRSMLQATGAAVGLSSVSGCLNPAEEDWIFGEQNTEPDPSVKLRDITIKEAPTDRTNPYFVSLSDDLVENSDIDVFDGKQVRLKIQNDVEGESSKPYLYTVNTEPEYTAEEKNTIWVSKNGLDRMDIVSGTVIIIEPYAATPQYDTQAQAEENNELIEQYIEHENNSVLCIAPYGGDIYTNTELQALRGSSEYEYNIWSLIGYDTSTESAIQRWYNPPEFYSPESFYGLSTLDSSYEYVISFVGSMEKIDSDVVLTGLANDTLKQEIKSAIEAEFTSEESENPIIDVELQYGEDSSAIDPQNITNNLTSEDSNGLIIKQSDEMIANNWKQVSDAVLSGVSEFF